MRPAIGAESANSRCGGGFSSTSTSVTVSARYLPERRYHGLKLLSFESVDEFDGGEEPDALAVMPDGLDADRRGEMRLPRAGAADQDDIVGVFQELASVELAQQRLVNLAAGEVAIHRCSFV